MRAAVKRRAGSARADRESPGSHPGTPVALRRTRFQGEPAIELTTDELRLVAITRRGPRIAHLSRLHGENLFYWVPGKHRRGDWDMLGGHRLWTTRPGADECEETYRPDNRPCAVVLQDNGFSLSAPVDPVTRLRREIAVRAVASDRLEIEHLLENTGDMLWSGGLWGVTCTVPAEYTCYIVPLTSGVAWDSATLTLFNGWGDGRGGQGYEDRQFSFTADSLVLRPKRRENKRAIGARPGVIAMYDPARGILFAKRSSFDPAANYPRGANLALYTGGAGGCYTELETMSPLVTLEPGQMLRHTESWVLGSAKGGMPSSQSLRALFESASS